MCASPLRRALFLALIFLSVSAVTTTAFGYSTSIQQTKDKWITVEILKYQSGELEMLLQELRSYEEKISTVTFNEETRHLTVYYSSAVSYDDILQIVGKYYSDFNKVGGTEL